MELNIFQETKEKAIKVAAKQAVAMFEHFGFRVLSEDCATMVVPNIERVEQIIRSLIESVDEEELNEYPARSSTARMSVTKWGFEDARSYLIAFNIGEWDEYDADSE